jgi:hypothetical protein
MLGEFGELQIRPHDAPQLRAVFRFVEPSKDEPTSALGSQHEGRVSDIPTYQELRLLVDDQESRALGQEHGFRLIVRGFFRAIDNENLNATSRRLKPQAELLL